MILLGVIVFSVISYKLEEAARINYHVEFTNPDDIDISKFELTYYQAVRIAQNKVTSKIIYSCRVYPTYRTSAQDYTYVGKFWVVQFFHDPPIPPTKVTNVVVNMSGEVMEISEVTFVVGG